MKVKEQVKVADQGQGKALTGKLIIDMRRRITALKVNDADCVQLHDGDPVAVLDEGGKVAHIVSDRKPLALRGTLCVMWDRDAVGVLVGDQLCPLAGGEALRAG